MKPRGDLHETNPLSEGTVWVARWLVPSLGGWLAPVVGRPSMSHLGRCSYGVELVSMTSHSAADAALGCEPGYVRVAESRRVGRATPHVPLHQSGDANEQV